MPTYFCKNGSEVISGRLLGKGGEANVYSVATQPKYAVKIYKSPPTKDTVKKLKKLAAMSAIDNTAWPLELVFESKQVNNVVGYLMPISDGKTWNNFNMAASRASLSGYNLTSTFFYNMLNSFAKVLCEVHNTGLIIGDINDSNVLIGIDGYSTVIDIDSFQVNSQLVCLVSRPEYLSADLHGAALNIQVRSQKHDHFAASVLFWSLLFNGVHPFGGFGNPTSIPERIKAGLCVGSKNYSPPKFQCDVDDLPDELLDLFVKAFNLQPIDSNAWVKAFSKHEIKLKGFFDNSLQLSKSVKNPSNSTNSATSHYISQTPSPSPTTINTSFSVSTWMKYAAAVILAVVLISTFNGEEPPSQAKTLAPMIKLPPLKKHFPIESYAAEHNKIFGSSTKKFLYKKVPALSSKEKGSFVERHNDIFSKSKVIKND
jgi:serine/threonine protein kinase